MTDIQAEAMDNADLIAFGLAHSDPVVRALAKALDDAPSADEFEAMNDTISELRAELEEVTNDRDALEEAVLKAPVHP